MPSEPLTLFPDVTHPGAVSKSAGLSPCGTYRYWLRRSWPGSGRVLCAIGLNPSTADAVKDDPTIRRLMGFARQWNCSTLWMLNLFAFRATDPQDMRSAADPVGPENDRHLLSARTAHVVLAAWGTHGWFRDRDCKVLHLLSGCRLWCLGTTKDGHPRHPLYVAGNQELIPFREKTHGQ